MEMAKSFMPLLPITYNFQYNVEGFITNFLIVINPQNTININIFLIHQFNQKYGVFKSVEAKEILVANGSFKKAKSVGNKTVFCELNPEYKYHNELNILIDFYLDMEESTNKSIQ